MDQNNIQCCMNGICNDPVDLDPFLKIAEFFSIFFILFEKSYSICFMRVP